jgi:hypothetical protein
MSVRNWGESSAGDWTVLVDDGLSEFAGTWIDAQLILHGTDGSCAVSDLTLDDDVIDAGIYRTNAGINSAGTIPVYTEVAYQAGTQIVLSPGFHATAGSKFFATIATCSVPEVLTQQPREEIPMEQIAVPVTAANLRIFPNPVTENATITYALEQETEVMIEFLDLNGRRIQLLQPNALLPAGPHQWEMHTASLPAGMYVVRMRSAQGQVMVERVVVE